MIEKCYTEGGESGGNRNTGIEHTNGELSKKYNKK